MAKPCALPFDPSVGFMPIRDFSDVPSQDERAALPGDGAAERSHLMSHANENVPFHREHLGAVEI